jgi:hypothetical protein
LLDVSLSLTEIFSMKKLSLIIVALIGVVSASPADAVEFKNPNPLPAIGKTVKKGGEAATKG